MLIKMFNGIRGFSFQGESWPNNICSLTSKADKTALVAAVPNRQLIWHAVLGKQMNIAFISHSLANKTCN